MIASSLAFQSPPANSLPKHNSRTLIMIAAAVEAPGDAPSSATSERSCAATISVPNFRMPPFTGSRLMIWTRIPARCIRQSLSCANG